MAAIAKTNYAVVEEDPFGGGDAISAMDRSNDDPIIWHERVLQVRVVSRASPDPPLLRVLSLICRHGWLLRRSICASLERKSIALVRAHTGEILGASCFY
eukprot:COSAG02_NODE_218_length_28570_cov_75.594816_19_plen_100_part_00